MYGRGWGWGGKPILSHRGPKLIAAPLVAQPCHVPSQCGAGASSFIATAMFPFRCGIPLSHLHPIPVHPSAPFTTRRRLFAPSSRNCFNLPGMITAAAERAVFTSPEFLPVISSYYRFNDAFSIIACYSIMDERGGTDASTVPSSFFFVFSKLVSLFHYSPHEKKREEREN